MTDWHGLADRDAMALWDQFDWRLDAARALVKVAENDLLSVELRIEAISLLNFGALHGLIDATNVPAFIARVMTRMLALKPVTGWFARRRAKREAAHASEVVSAVRNLFYTVRQFEPEEHPSNALGFLKHGELPS